MTEIVTTTRYQYVNVDSRLDDYIDSLYHESQYHIHLPEHIRHIDTLSIVSIEIPITYYNISCCLGNNQFGLSVTLTVDTPTVDTPTLSDIDTPPIYDVSALYINDASALYINDVSYVCNVSKTNMNVSCIITIPDDNYTPNSLVEVIEREINKIPELNNVHVRLTPTGRIEFYSIASVDRIEFYSTGKIEFAIGYPLVHIMGFRHSIYHLSSCIAERLCDLTNPRYVYLEIKEHNHDEHRNHYGFVSSYVCSHILKHAIARIVIDTKMYPYGSIVMANLFNGMLISDIRKYHHPVHLHKLHIRLVDEYGYPIDLNGSEISLCAQVTYRDDT